MMKARIRIFDGNIENNINIHLIKSITLKAKSTIIYFILSSLAIRIN